MSIGSSAWATTALMIASRIRSGIGSAIATVPGHGCVRPEHDLFQLGHRQGLLAPVRYQLVQHLGQVPTLPADIGVRIPLGLRVGYVIVETPVQFVLTKHPLPTPSR